jgi:DNA-binding NtrC family response regulator
LVVDDNESVRDSLARRLRAGGHEVMVAGDITAARARLRLGVDALVTDVLLGGAEDGVALALEARGQDQFLALVFISGVMSSRQPELLQGDDMASFLRKPVNMSELSAVLDGLLAMRALGRGR